MFYYCIIVLRNYPRNGVVSVFILRPCERADGMALPSYFSLCKREGIHAAAGSGRTGLMCCRVSFCGTLPSLYFWKLQCKTVGARIRKAGTQLVSVPDVQAAFCCSTEQELSEKQIPGIVQSTEGARGALLLWASLSPVARPLYLCSSPVRMNNRKP